MANPCLVWLLRCEIWPVLALNVPHFCHQWPDLLRHRFRHQFLHRMRMFLFDLDWEFCESLLGCLRVRLIMNAGHLTFLS